MWSKHPLDEPENAVPAQFPPQHRTITRRGAGLTLGIVLVAALAACGGNAGSEGSASDDVGSAPPSTALESPSIKVGVIQIAGVTPIYAAQELGYFEEEGLEVSLETSSGGAASLPLLSQGDLQITNAPPVSVIVGRAQGFDFTILPPSLDGEASSPGQTAVLAKKDSGISSLADLAGKRVAVNTINSVNWLYNRALLSSAGVDLETVTYVELPFPSMIDALNGGSVDAIDVPQPFFHIAEQTGGTETLGYTFSDVQPSVPITAYSATDEWIAENPNTLAAFSRAMTKAVEYMRENETEAKSLIAEYTGAEPALVDEIALNKWSTAIDVEGVQRTADLMVEEGMIDEAVDVSEFVLDPATR